MQATRLFLQRRPPLLPPPLDRCFVALDRPGDRNLGCPSQPLQQAGHLALTIGDAELLGHNPAYPLTAPNIASEAVRLRAMPEEVRQEPDLIRSELANR